MENLTAIIKRTGETIKERKTSPLEEEVSSLPACEICSDTHFTVKKIKRHLHGDTFSVNEVVVPCICRKKRILNAKLAKIPKRFLGRELPQPLPAEIFTPTPGERDNTWAAARYFNLVFEAQYEKRSLFLFGKLGTCKTTLMWKQYETLTRQGIFTTYADTAIEMVKKYQDQCYKEVVHYDFEQEGLHVFMDDLDKVSMTEDRSMQLYDIFDQIYKSNNKLTITSNLSLTEMDIAETLGCRTSAITRRIMDICAVVRFN